MILHAARYARGAHTVVSKVYDGDLELCRFLEDELRGYGEKVPGATAIPAGLYRISPVHDSKMAQVYYDRFSWFRGLPGLEWAGDGSMVPRFDLLRIHPGNEEKHTRGCPLTGSEVALVDGDYETRGSTDAFKLLCHRLYAAWDRGEETFLRISDDRLVL